MKILYFTQGQSPHDLRFLSALASTAHQVAVLCLGTDASQPWPQGIREFKWGSNLPEIDWSNLTQYQRSLKQILAEFQPDIIHAGPVPSTAYLAASIDAHPLLSMSWGSDLLLETESDTNIYQRAYLTLQKSDMLAADCQTVVRKARELGYRGPVSVFPWGVDLDYFSPSPMGELRKRLGWEDRIVLLCNRAWEPLYGVDMVADAFAMASKINPKLRLLLYGKGSQEKQIRAILQQAEGKVYYGGFVDLPELPDVYRSADYYISASHSDGSSVSLMEALACGKPALVSDIPSNREWIENGKTGWFFRDGDAEELAQFMSSRANSDNVSSYAQNSRQLALTRADWKKNFAILLEAYSHLAHGRE